MVKGECGDLMPGDHYSAILRRNPSTSSRMFKEKNFGNSVEDGVRDSGGMCRKAFLERKNGTKQTLCYQRHTFLCPSCLQMQECGVLLRAVKDSLSQCGVSLHGRRDQGGEERQVPDGRSIRHRHLFALGDLIAQRLQTVNPSVTSVAQAPFNVDLDVCGEEMRRRK